MRIAIVSDIHSNIQAWNVVWANLATQKIDKVICLGDIVGYGPRPAETLAAVYKNVDRVIMGNHDAVVAGIDNASRFNPAAKAMIEWTVEQLDKKAKKFFEALPYTLKFKAGGLTALCVHGHPHNPKEFNYVKTNSDLPTAWEATHADIIFVGHTHIPRVDILNSDGTLEQCEPENIKIENDKRYLINVGSVGIPRGSNDFRACYCVYDIDLQTVTYHRCAYDIEALKKDLSELNGLPSQAKRVIEMFEKIESGNLREEVDFAVTTPEELSKNGSGDKLTNRDRNSSKKDTTIEKKKVSNFILNSKHQVWASTALFFLLCTFCVFFLYSRDPFPSTQGKSINYKQTLLAEEAILSGPGLRLQKSSKAIGFWQSPQAITKWQKLSLSPGMNTIVLIYSCSKGGKKFVIKFGEHAVNAITESTESLQAYKRFQVGILNITKRETDDITIQMTELKEGKLFNLKRMEIIHESRK
jgi:putative phosphoesterase